VPQSDAKQKFYCTVYYITKFKARAHLKFEKNAEDRVRSPKIMLE
jgi:hypothetical protein